MRWGRGVLSLWLATGAVTLAALGITGARAAQAGRNAAAAQAQLVSVRSQAERLIALRNSHGEVASSPGPLAQRVNDALAAAGLPSGTLSGLSPESATTQRATPTSAMTMRKRATLTLAPITLPQVGKFLATWRAQEPAWSVAGVDLAPEGSRVVPTGGDLPLRAVVVIETVMPAEGSQPHLGESH